MGFRIERVEGLNILYGWTETEARVIFRYFAEGWDDILKSYGCLKMHEDEAVCCIFVSNALIFLAQIIEKLLSEIIELDINFK